MHQRDLVARAISAKANRRVNLNSGDLTSVNENIGDILDCIKILTMRVAELEMEVKKLSETDKETT